MAVEDAEPTSTLRMAVIYNPSDLPPGFAVRFWSSTPDGGSLPDAVHAGAGLATIEEARELITPGMYNLGRMKDDDPVIHEVWV